MRHPQQSALSHRLMVVAQTQNKLFALWPNKFSSFLITQSTTSPKSTTWRNPIPTLPVQCAHILCSCIHHPDKLQLQRVSTWSQIASWMDIPSASPPRLSSIGNKPLVVSWTPPGYLPLQSVVLCLGTGAVQRELSVTATAQTGSILLGNNVLIFLLLFCAMCHGWPPPNQITFGTAQTGFLSKTAANAGFLLPFWESLCSLLILLPAPNDSKRHEPWESPLPSKAQCTGYGWDGVNSHPNSLYGAGF